MYGNISQRVFCQREDYGGVAIVPPVTEGLRDPHQRLFSELVEASDPYLPMEFMLTPARNSDMMTSQRMTHSDVIMSQ